MYNKNLVVFLLIFLLGNSCTTSKPKEIQLSNFGEITVEQFKKKNVKISSDIEFTNPNKYSILLTQVDFDVIINGKDVGSYLSKSSKELTSKETIFIPIEFNFLPEQAFDSLKIGLINIKSDVVAEVKIKGTLTTKAIDSEQTTKLEATQQVLFTNSSKLYLDENNEIQSN